MKYLSTKEISRLWGIAERSVRDYCTKGRVQGAILNGKTWLIPENATKPTRQKRHSSKVSTLLEILQREKESKLSGGIYHKLQIEMTYNSNHIEGSMLTHDQTRYIYETRTIGVTNGTSNIDDIIETVNHFRCIDLVIDVAKSKLSESFIKQLHLILKTGTRDAEQPWFMVGGYKLRPNEIGDRQTTSPRKVKEEMKTLLGKYNDKQTIAIGDIIEFHKEFEYIHPFQDGNGRIGRLIMLKECLKHNIAPVLILDDFKQLYYRGLSKWNESRGYLIDTCLHGQDIMKSYLDYFHIDY